MMRNNGILASFKKEKGQLAILIDPEKTQDEKTIAELADRSALANVSYFFVGGSTVTPTQIENTIGILKKHTNLPIVIFPGDQSQIAKSADGLLYLSLLSGRNPEYLIGQHVASARKLFEIDTLEVIPTAYILVHGGTNSSVAYVSQTTPIPRDKTNIAINTALAGILQGKALVYYDAGSGANQPVPREMIRELSELSPEVPIIVGGGIKTVDEIQAYKNAGANIIVIGNHIEENINFFLELINYTKVATK